MNITIIDDRGLSIVVNTNHIISSEPILHLIDNEQVHVNKDEYFIRTTGNKSYTYLAKNNPKLIEWLFPNQ